MNWSQQSQSTSLHKCMVTNLLIQAPKSYLSFYRLLSHSEHLCSPPHIHCSSFFKQRSSHFRCRTSWQVHDFISSPSYYCSLLPVPSMASFLGLSALFPSISILWFCIILNLFQDHHIHCLKEIQLNHIILMAFLEFHKVQSLFPFVAALPITQN